MPIDDRKFTEDKRYGVLLGLDRVFEVSYPPYTLHLLEYPGISNAERVPMLRSSGRSDGSWGKPNCHSLSLVIPRFLIGVSQRILNVEPDAVLDFNLVMVPSVAYDGQEWERPAPRNIVDPSLEDFATLRRALKYDYDNLKYKYVNF